jgi:hypothetical protein
MGEVAEKHPVCVVVSKDFTNIYEFTLVFYRIVSAQVLWSSSGNRYACTIYLQTNRDSF